MAPAYLLSRHPTSWLPLVLFVVLTVGGGWAIGTLTGPDAWFTALRKPLFNPPNWLFGPVWTVLYVLIAIAGWRVWAISTGDGSNLLCLALWCLQLVFNFIWSPVFFVVHRIDLALAIIVVLLVAIIAFISAAWPRDRIAGLLFVPYALWVAFATALNAAFLSLNGSG